MISIIFIFNILLFVGLLSLAIVVRLYAMNQSKRGLFNATEEGLQKVKEIAQEYTQRVEMLNADAHTAERNASNIAKKMDENYTQLRIMHANIDKGQKVIAMFNNNAENLAQIFPLAKKTHHDLQKLLEESKEYAAHLELGQTQVQKVINACNRQESHTFEKLKQVEDSITDHISKRQEEINTILNSFKFDSNVVQEQLQDMCNEILNKSLETFSVNVQRHTQSADEHMNESIKNKQTEIDDVFLHIKNDVETKLSNLQNHYSKALEDVQTQTEPMFLSLEHVKTNVAQQQQEITGHFDILKEYINKEHNSIKIQNDIIHSDIRNTTHSLQNHKEYVQKELQKSGKEVINLLQGEVQNKKQALEDYAKNFETQLFEAYQQHTQKMQEIFNSLKTQVHEENANKRDVFKLDYDALFMQISAYCREKQTGIKEYYDQLVGAFNKLSEDAIVETDEYKEKIDHAKQFIGTSLNEHKKVISLSEEKAQSIITSYKEYLEESFAKVKEVDEEKIEDLRKDYKAMCSNVEQMLSEADVEFDNKQDQLLDKIGMLEDNLKEFEIKKIEALEPLLDVNGKLFTDYKSVAQDRIKDVVSTQHEENLTHIKLVLEEAAQSLESNANQIQIGIKNNIKGMTSDMEDAKSVVDAKIQEVNNTFGKLESYIDDKTEQTNNVVQKIELKLDKKISSIKELVVNTDTLVEQKIHEMKNSINRTVEKFNKQAKLLEEDTELVKKLEKMSSTVKADLDKTEHGLIELRSKYSECEKLSTKLSSLQKNIDDFANAFDKVRQQDGRIKAIIRDHTKMNKQIDKIDTRTEKIDAVLINLENKEERINTLKSNFSEIQIIQKHLKKQKDDLDDNTKQYEVALDHIELIDKNIVDLEKRSHILLQNLNSHDERSADIKDTLTNIESQKEKVDGIAAQVAGVVENIPNIMAKLEDINNTKGQIASLETRLQDLNLETAKKINMLKLVSSAPKKQASRLTEETKEKIQDLYGEFKYPPEKIAELFNISVSEVQGVVNQAFL